MRKLHSESVYLQAGSCAGPSCAVGRAI